MNGENQMNIEGVFIPHKILTKVITRELLELRLCDCKLIAPECRDLASNSNLKHLRVLDLSCNPIRVSGFLSLLDKNVSHLENLERLDVYMCSINQEQLKFLPKSMMQ
jgi:hypothetical protein